MGLLNEETPTIAEMVDMAEDRRQTSAIYHRQPHHVLRALMPLIVIRMYDLRSRSHNFVLPEHYTKARSQINNNDNLFK